MFVSELIPGLWICDYDIIKSNYFDTRNINLYIHVYTYQIDRTNIPIKYTQYPIEIHVKDIICSRDSSIVRQNKQYAVDYGRQIYATIDTITNNLRRMCGVVIYSKYGIQKAATLACSYLIRMGNLNKNIALKIMQSKEPLFFKIPESNNRADHVILYDDTLRYIENKY